MKIMNNDNIYLQKPMYHFKPYKGWINNPNGLVYFKNKYHAFYQHCPDFELPWKQPVHWEHAVTKNLIDWEELPVALKPNERYDFGGHNYRKRLFHCTQRPHSR